MKQCSAFFLSVFLVCAYASAQAADVTLDVAPIRADYRATERSASNTVLNEETGTLQGLSLRAEARRSVDRLAFDVSNRQGTINYQGATQIGLPITTKTDLRIVDYALSYESYDRPLSELDRAWGWSGIVSVGSRHIERDILPTLVSTALSETLTWRYARFGTRLEYLPSDKVSVDAHAAFERGLNGTLDVNFHGLADNTTVYPSDANGYGVGLNVQWRAARHITIGASYDLHDQKYGASPTRNLTQSGVAIGQLRYPGSKQILKTFGLHLIADLP
jgi:hypothetical protein